MRIIGQSVPRIDALGKVTGEALYPGDISLPNQATMKILFSGRPHAIIRRIDTSAAERMPGVLAVLTAKDVPVNEYGYVLLDQPVLCGPGSNTPYADRVRFVGDQVAIVIAEEETIASEALKRIIVDFCDLPVITDPEAAQAPDAPLLHPDKSSNVLSEVHFCRGDAEKALAEADVIIEGEYRTPAQEHAYLQPEAGVAYVDEQGCITVYVAGQWPHKDRRQIAYSLGLPEEQIRVIYPAVGGAFGGREDMSVQIVLALAVLRLHQRGINRPVKVIWSREESIVGHHKRHPYILRTKWGATREGKVVAAQCQVIQDAGAYAYTSTKILPTTALTCTGPYDIPNIKVDAYSVYTNHVPSGAFRGFGAPQGCFVAEMQMSKLAEALAEDPVEIRLKNMLRAGSLLSVGTPLPEDDIPLDRVLMECAKRAGWQETARGWQKPPHGSLGGPLAPHLRRGIGIACAYKNIGFSWGVPESCEATIELHGGAKIEEVILRHAAAEVGQGVHTVLIQMAAEAVGVPVDRVRLVASDTALTGDSGSVSASRMTFMAGNAVRKAAQGALENWKKEDRPAIATGRYVPPATTAFDPQAGKAKPYLAYGYVAEAVTAEVDTETGCIRLLSVICADDVGQAINPKQVQGQIEGGVVQAVGYAVLENFLQENGYVQTRNLSTYLIPTVLDVPDEVQSLILEYPNPVGPWGARGVGEMPFIPLAPALAAAIHNATGIWFDDLPITPERVLRGLGRIP